jgi:hypothetical protein
MAAVATASVLLAADGRLDTGAAAFSDAVTVLQAPGSRQAPEETVGRLLALRGHGMTDIAAAIRSAAVLLSGARELSGAGQLSNAGQLSGPASGPAERCVILLSDCLRTAGSDPAAALTGIDRLDVLCPLPAGTDPDPESLAAAERLARLGGGISQPVRTLRDVPAALTRLLSAR